MLEEIEPVTIERATLVRARPQYTFWILLGLVGLLATGLRLYALDLFPQLFNQDEMVLGYDSWSIWNTRRDQYGQFFPIYFRTYNDAVPPVGNYLTAPFVGLLGLSEFSTRLPFALLGIATVGLVGLLGRRWFGWQAGLIAALLLALDPWHLNYSRIAFPVSSVPFFTVAALYCFTIAIAKLKTQPDKLTQRSYRIIGGWFLASALSFALLTGTHPVMKLQAPLLIGICIIGSFLLLWKYKALALTWLLGYAVFSSPLWIVQFLNWEQIQLRYNQVSIFTSRDWLSQFFAQYAAHYNAAALFFEGYRGGVSVHPSGIGELFWLEGPLWIVALVGLVQQGRSLRERTGLNLAILSGLWFATFPIAASLTNKNLPHEIRAYNFEPLPQLLAGYGAIVLWQKLAVYRWRWFSLAQAAALGAAGLLLVFSTVFLSDFFGAAALDSNTPVSDLPFNLGMRLAVEKVAQEARPCDEIWVEPGPQTYMYYLFLTRYPPRTFQQAAKEIGSSKDGWVSIPWFDNVRFGVPGRDKITGSPKVECQGQVGRIFFVSHTIPTGPEWKELAATRRRDGEAVWRGLVRAP